MQRELAEVVKAKARELGFDLVGITGAEPSVFAEEYRDWMSGYAGEMDYLTRDLHRRLDPRELLPDARSIIVVGMNYYADTEEGRKRRRCRSRSAPCLPGMRAATTTMT